MKPSKRISKLLKFVDYLEEIFKYYLGDSYDHKFQDGESSVSVSQMFNMMRDQLIQHNKSDKLKSIELFQKFKKQEGNNEVD